MRAEPSRIARMAVNVHFLARLFPYGSDAILFAPINFYVEDEMSPVRERSRYFHVVSFPKNTA